MYNLVLLLICEGNFDFRASIDLLLNTSCLHSLHQSESADWEEVKHAGEIPKQLSWASTPQEPVKHSVPLNLTKRGCTTPTIRQNTISTQLTNILSHQQGMHKSMQYICMTRSTQLTTKASTWMNSCKEASWVSLNSLRMLKRSISERDTMIRMRALSSVPSPCGESHSA